MNLGIELSVTNRYFILLALFRILFISPISHIRDGTDKAM
jgi:hypothetical protein